MLLRGSKMKTIKQIAEAYNLSPNSVKTWSTAKRERASTLIDLQINPQIMQLVGELSALCFATSNMSNKLVFAPYTKCGYGHFNINMLDSEVSEFFPLCELTVANLKAAIAKVEEVVYAQ